MVNNLLENKGVTKEAASYCFRSIISLLDGNNKKFEEYASKAIEINNEIEEKINWTSCNFKVNGKKIKAKINTKHHSLRHSPLNLLSLVSSC